MIKIELVHRDAVIIIDAETPGSVGDAVKRAIKAVDFAMNDLSGFQGDSTPPRGTEPGLAWFQCHKLVKGGKIVGFQVGDRGRATLTVVMENGLKKNLVTREGWTERFRGGDYDLGYYVEYEDGFTSWSPSEAFEDGYRRIT